MEKRHRRISGFERHFQTKLNEHEMLMNTLHEALSKPNISAESLNGIRRAIADTESELESLRTRENKTVSPEHSVYKTNLFDSIEKVFANDSVMENIMKDTAKEVELSPKKHTYKGGARADFSIFDNIQKENNIKEKKLYNLSEEMKTDNIVLCNRFLFDLSVIGIPATMVRSVGGGIASDRTLYVEAYDFVDDWDVPVMKKLTEYNGRKFTAEIQHLDATGKAIYKDKYNGCLLLTDDICRETLRYRDSEPTTISFKILYDGVTYEAGC